MNGVRVRIVDGPLAPWTASTSPDGAGAMLLFEGIVREREGDGVIEALDYEAYQPMAERMLAQLGEELVGRFGLSRMVVEHSRGRVPVGERSFRLVVESPHRAEALKAMAEFVDRMKKDVPIWKAAVWRGEGRSEQ